MKAGTPRTQIQVTAMNTLWSEWAATHDELLFELDASWDAEVRALPPHEFAPLRRRVHVQPSRPCVAGRQGADC
jgi:hypothetical protein